MEEQPIDKAIIINTYLVQKFMNHGRDFANLLALYTFYIHHANLQKTNQPLATDYFASKGLNWGIDRVKNTKRILKEMKVIEVVQKKKYYYVHLFFIYTKKKIADILGEVSTSKESVENKETACLHPNEVEAKNDKTRLKALTPSVPVLFEQWIKYCDKNSIRYNKNNLNYWQNKLENRTTIEQKEAIYTAISKKWKNFYIPSIKESKYHKFLGKSLMMKKNCDTLLDIGLIEGKFVYQFKNIKVTTAELPKDIFKRCGYDNAEAKDAPIVSNVKDKLLGLINRF